MEMEYRPVSGIYPQLIATTLRWDGIYHSFRSFMPYTLYSCALSIRFFVACLAFHSNPLSGYQRKPLTRLVSCADLFICIFRILNAIPDSFVRSLGASVINGKQWEVQTDTAWCAQVLWKDRIKVVWIRGMRIVSCSS